MDCVNYTNQNNLLDNSAEYRFKHIQLGLKSNCFHSL